MKQSVRVIFTRKNGWWPNHERPGGYQRDMLKYAEALALEKGLEFLTVGYSECLNCGDSAIRKLSLAREAGGNAAPLGSALEAWLVDPESDCGKIADFETVYPTRQS